MTEAKMCTTGDQEWNERLDELYQQRLDVIHGQEHTSASLQTSHDLIIKKAVCLALKKTESEWGQPPTHFTFFLMGSGGRLEQSFWSDQDHGIIFDRESRENQTYFLQLGKEIVYALKRVGYEPCDGNVMASNVKWCRSVRQWKEQIERWLQENKWETLRYTLTFFDSRTLFGEANRLNELKDIIFQEIERNPHLMARFTHNTGRLRKGIGLFNQLLVETKGKHQGKLDFKQVIMFPYVNGLRLLAIEEHIYEASTIERFKKLPPKYESIKQIQASYERLLDQRIAWQKHVRHYDDIHHFSLENMSHSDKQKIKGWIREGHQLYQKIERICKKGETT